MLGIVLLVLGAVLIAIEAHVPTLGFLGGPGVIALGAGALLAATGAGAGVALAVLAAMLLVTAGGGAVLVSVRKGLDVRRRRIRVGPERLVGHLGTVRRWAGPTGSVLVDGALWRARRSPGDEDPEAVAGLEAGDPIVVERLDGLTLAVRPAEDWELVR